MEGEKLVEAREQPREENHDEKIAQTIRRNNLRHFGKLLYRFTFEETWKPKEILKFSVS